MAHITKVVTSHVEALKNVMVIKANGYAMGFTHLPQLTIATQIIKQGQNPFGGQKINYEKLTKLMSIGITVLPKTKPGKIYEI